MSGQHVASSMLSVATLQWPLHASTAEALARSAHARLPQMDSQGIANVLWAQAWFVASGCASVRLDHGAFFTLCRRAGQEAESRKPKAGEICHATALSLGM